VLFVHGYLVNGDLWRKVAPQLQGELRCIVPDWPMGSHEIAMPPEADLSPPGMAKLIADFMAALDLEDVVIVANDSGGAISQIVVTEYPDRVGALVLTPCDAFEKFPPAPYNLLPKIAKTPLLRNVAGQSMRVPLFRWAAFRPLMTENYDGELVESWVRPGLKDRGIARDGAKFSAGMDAKHTKRAAAKLPQFDRPALITWPPDCDFFTFDLAERLADAIPDARVVEIGGSQTFLPVDQPNALAGEIRTFALA
jgi:pimeloyl-ACP methyl ester carboxylesterase